MKKLTQKQRLQWWENTATFYRMAWAGQVEANKLVRQRLTIQVGKWKLAAVWSWAVCLGLALGVVLMKAF